jgi:hypothetical protein
VIFSGRDFVPGHFSIDQHLPQTSMKELETIAADTILAKRDDITFGEKTWPDHFYNDPWVNVSIPFVSDFVFYNPTATNFHISYDKLEDFQTIDFILDGEKYQVRWYKVFKLVRLSDNAYLMFGCHNHRISDFFAHKRHTKPESWITNELHLSSNSDGS